MPLMWPFGRWTVPIGLSELIRVWESMVWESPRQDCGSSGSGVFPSARRPLARFGRPSHAHTRGGAQSERIPDDCLWTTLGGGSGPRSLLAGSVRSGRDRLCSRLGRSSSDRSLNREETRYRTILDEIHDGYFEVDLAANLVFFNAALISILGYSAEGRSTVSKCGTVVMSGNTS